MKKALPIVFLAVTALTLFYFIGGSPTHHAPEETGSETEVFLREHAKKEAEESRIQASGTEKLPLRQTIEHM